MSKPLDVAVIGCGQICQWQHIPALIDHPDVRIRYVCDRDRFRRERAARITDARSLERPNQALSSAVDAVIIATHDLMHASLVEQALAAEKHVFVEKPLALTAVEGERILALAENGGKVVTVGFQRLHDPTLQRVAALMGTIGTVQVAHMHDYCHENDLVIRESLLGPLTSAEFRAGRSDLGDQERWAALARKLFPGSHSRMLDTYRLIMNLACHDLSVLVAVLGEPTALDFVDLSPELFGVLLYRFGDVRVVLEIGQTKRRWFDECLRIVGAEGTLEATWGSPFVPSVPATLSHRLMESGAEVTRTERITHKSLFRAELWDFVQRALSNGSRDGSLANAVTVTRWLEAAIREHVAMERAM